MGEVVGSDEEINSSLMTGTGRESFTDWGVEGDEDSASDSSEAGGS